MTGSPAAAASRQIKLRTKALVAFALLAVYFLIAGRYVASVRQSLLVLVQQLEQVHAQQESLARVNTAVAHSIVTLQGLLDSPTITPQYDDIRLDIASIELGLPDLKERYPGIADSFVLFEKHVAEMNKGRSRDDLIALRDSERDLVKKLERAENLLDNRNVMLAESYRASNQQITLIALTVGLAGLGALGIAATFFFTRLSGDLARLESRAIAIVNGYRGAPLAVTRRDEVGSLMTAVNRMQAELSTREQQQEISRQQLFHQEKMAAVGALAAAVAHEVNNPINAISGIAQFTLDAIQSEQWADKEMMRKHADLTLRETERIGQIMRQLADLSAPRSLEPELLNINDLVHATCSFIRYDKRLGGIDLLLDLDPHLPAIRIVSDHLTQVLMNLLINAADAMEGVAGRKPTIRVSTRKVGEEAQLSVSDNGQGMDSDVLSRAFEKSFSTKPTGKGWGIGLYLCKTLIEESGGRIELQSIQGVGTVAQIHLPTNQD